MKGIFLTTQNQTRDLVAGDGLSIAGVHVLQLPRFSDDRGMFSKLFDAEYFSRLGWNSCVRQVNHSHTERRGTVRGLHFQTFPSPEMKLVTCIRGSVWDVVVDAREDSRSYLRWQSQVLSAENGNSVLIPEHVAHGFQALCDDCELIYVHSAGYDRSAERGMHPLDPLIGIPWPLQVQNLSARDQSFALLPSMDGMS